MGSRRTRTAAVTGPLLALALVGPAWAASGSWAPEQLPGIAGRSYVTAMASTSTQRWAAGLTRTFLPGAIETRTLVLHHDGAGWHRENTPTVETAPARDQLLGTAAVSNTDVWAVGSSGRPASGASTTLVQHYDGTAWTQSPSPPFSATSTFLAVSALGNGRVWAVGLKGGPEFGGFVPLVAQRRSTGAWVELPFAEPLPRCALSSTELTAVQTVSVSEVYVAGSCQRDGARQAFVRRWDGARWWTSVVAPPKSLLTGLAGGRGGQPVWVVGHADPPDGVVGRTRPLAYVGDETSWRAQHPPRSTTVDQRPLAVAATPGADAPVYAVGRTAGPDSTQEALALRWDGTRWSRELVHGLFTPLYGVTAQRNGDATAGGWSLPGSDEVATIVRRNRG